MHRIVTRLAKLASERGFSLVEILVGGLVLVVGLVMISQFFASAAARVLDSDIRSVLHEVATEELESIRGLLYTDVGTTDGQPRGTLIPDEDRVVQNVTVHIHRAVVYWRDPSYTGPYPANYRRVTLTVSAANHVSVDPVEVVSNVAGGATGGTLDITVTDITGAPVEDAQIVITNTHLVPNVNIHSSDLKTDSQGKMIVPGLDPDSTTSYVVTVSKTGYNSAHTDPAVVVLDGSPYTVVQLTIDRLATMVVKVVDTNGVPVTGLNMRVQGPLAYDQYFTSTASGETLSNMRYSTDLDPYVVRLRSGQGYAPQDISVVLAPGSAREVVVTVPAGGPTTTTTTTVPATTTTTAPVPATLRVTVYRSGSSPLTKLGNATVTLSNGQSRTTPGTNPSNGLAIFDPLPSGTYGMTVTKNNYVTYSGTVVVSGSTSVSVYLVRQ